MGDLPPLPVPENEADTDDCTYACPEGFSADQMRAYAEEAVRQEREAILAAIDDIEGKPWYGYENPNTFQDAKWAAMDVVRARSEQGDCGNAECGWRGPISECSYLGSVGPCCPRCREIVEPDHAAAIRARSEQGGEG